MEKILVVYYSRTGSNQFLAKQFSKTLQCDIEEIEPKRNSLTWLLLLGLMKRPIGIKKLGKNPADYDKIILVSPIWTGQLISPLRGFLKKYKRNIKQLYFATCCGVGDEGKDDKFGYVNIFNQLREEVEDIPTECAAFPIPLVIPEDKMDDDEYVMNTRLNTENFKGEIQERFEGFIEKMREAAVY